MRKKLGGTERNGEKGKEGGGSEWQNMRNDVKSKQRKREKEMRNFPIWSIGVDYGSSLVD